MVVGVEAIPMNSPNRRAFLKNTTTLAAGAAALGIAPSVRAVGANEKITAEVEVTAVRDDKPICELATNIYGEDGQICLSGTATVYVVPLRELMSSPQEASALGE